MISQNKLIWNTQSKITWNTCELPLLSTVNVSQQHGEFMWDGLRQRWCWWKPVFNWMPLHKTPSVISIPCWYWYSSFVKWTQPLIFLLSYPDQFGSLINVRYKRNLKVEYFIFKKIFSKNPKVPLPLKNWLPEQNMALKTWLPEQNMALKYWYRNRMCLSNISIYYFIWRICKAYL